MHLKKLICLFFLISTLWNSSLIAEEKEANAGALFVKIPIFVVPVIQNRDLRALYSITLILEVADHKIVDQAAKVMPVLNDRIYTDLYGLLSVVWNPEVNIPIADIKKRLQLVCEKVLGKNSVKAVLVQDFSRQIFN